MITVYIWQGNGDAGHASMKITRQAGTKYYSWWPSGAASLVNPRGLSEKGSTGEGHIRRNPISYGDTHVLPRVVGVSDRKVQYGAHHPGGGFGYNRSDKSMESGAAATQKFYFRPTSGINADRAEDFWNKHLTKSRGRKAEYNFVKNNCSTFTLKALQKAAEGLKLNAAHKAPKHKGALAGMGVSPASLCDYCTQLASAINNNILLWTEGIPPVVMAIGKDEVERFVDPSNQTPVAGFNKVRRHEPHPARQAL